MHGEFKPPGGKLVAADVAAMTARITAALGGDAVLAGFTAGTVAAAVRRALTRGSGRRDHDWRFVRDEPQDPALHMALDEVLAREVVAGRRPPTLRIWEWSAPAGPQCATTSVAAAHSAGQTPLNTAIEFGNRLLPLPARRDRGADVHHLPPLPAGRPAVPRPEPAVRRAPAGRARGTSTSGTESASSRRNPGIHRGRSSA